ncbi:MAG: ATP-dependent helicase [Aquabacterium sp.]|nr:MAG: ATP-dependent helicase [Aquabacterium sp.]
MTTTSSKPTEAQRMSDARFVPKGIVPTAEQLAIQLGRHKRVIVEANAGAAKTTTLALRLAQALERGADADRILALTYTDAAVLALKQALERIGLPAAVRNRLKIRTFDDFCRARLQHVEGGSVHHYERPEQLKPYVLQAIDRVMSNVDERHADEFAVEGNGEAMVESLLQAFSRLKGTLQWFMEAADQVLTPDLANELGFDYLTLRSFWAYETLRRGGHPDHPVFRAPHDATYDLACQLLDEDAFADQAHPLAMGLHLVLVDEMHDTNRAMFTVLRHLLIQNPQTAFVGVGDRDQVIHAVAGAEAGFMGETFNREIGTAERLPLTASYRFGPKLAASVSKLADKRYESLSSIATDIQLVGYEHVGDAHRHIIELIQQRVGLGPKATLSDLAILLRQPHQSVALENHLLDKGVDYRTCGFDTYLMRPEVLFVRGLIACARNSFAGIERIDTRMRVLQAMLTFAGSHVESAQDTQEDRLKEEHEAIKSVAHTPELVEVFLENQILRNASEAARRQLEAAIDIASTNATHVLLERFVAALAPQALAARVMVQRQDIAQVSANVQGLIDSAATYDDVESFFRAMNEREIRQQGMRGKDCVVLSSIEAAKGLEFDHVILPGLNKGEFAVGGNTTDNRNLLYVGMTRARQRLTILCDRHRPSQYLVDAGLL